MEHPGASWDEITAEKLIALHNGDIEFKSIDVSVNLGMFYGLSADLSSDVSIMKINANNWGHVCPYLGMIRS